MNFPPELVDQTPPWPLPINPDETLLYNVPPSEHSEDFQVFSLAGIDAVPTVSLQSPPQSRTNETTIHSAISDTSNDDSGAIDQSSPLLTFRAVDQKTLDVYNCLGQSRNITIAAHLSGIFNVSRNAQGDVQNLVCYRRNLFHIDGSILVPSDVDVVSTHGVQSQILKVYAELVAFSNQNGEQVKIVALPRTSRMSSNLATTQSPLPKQLDFRQSAESSNIHTFRLDWSRLQFRTATAKAGGTKERRSQNFFQISIQVKALMENGSILTLCEASTLPIVVRGRSPKNFRISREIISTRGTSSNHDLISRPDSQAANSTLSLPLSNPIEVSDDIMRNERQILSIYANGPSIQDREARPPQMYTNMIHGKTYPSVVLGGNSQGDGTSVAFSTLDTPDQKNSFYRYLPLAADDRTPAVQAVYQPHYVHHKLTIPAERLGINKRYFGEPLNVKSSD